MEPQPQQQQHIRGIPTTAFAGSAGGMDANKHCLDEQLFQLQQQQQYRLEQMKLQLQTRQLQLQQLSKDTTMTFTKRKRKETIVKHKRRFCRIEGCDSIVKSKGFCQRHGGKSPTCKVEGCTKQSQGKIFNMMCKAHFNDHNNHNPFSREEDLCLWEGHKQLGNKWVEISMKSFQSTRTVFQIEKRWYSMSFKEFISNEFGPDAYSECNPFGREDDLLLWEGYKKLGNKWVEISMKSFQSTRTVSQIKSRWYSMSFKEFISNEFGPDAYSECNPFGREDDLLLWEGYKKLGNKWVEISMKSFQSTKTVSQIKNRWYSMSFKEFISNEFGPDAYSECKSSLNENKLKKPSAKRQKLNHFQHHPCVEGIVKDNQKGKTLYTEKEIMKQVEDKLSTMNLTDVNRVIVYAYVCGILGYSSLQTVLNSGPKCFTLDKIETISEYQTYRISRVESGADCDPNLCCMFHSPYIHPECKIELIGQSLMNNFIIDEFFSKENGFATTIGTESSSSNGTPFGPGISDRNADRQKATMRESQLTTLQDLELSTSDGIQETKVALYNNFLQVRSDAIIANQNTDEMQADNTVIEACSRSDNRKIGSIYDNNERLIKLNPNSEIESQLHHVNSNHLRLKGTLPINKWKNNRGNDTNISLKKRSIRFSIGLRDTGKWLLHVLGSMTKSTQKKLLQDAYIYKSATCRLQAYMKIDPNDDTKNSLTLLLVCDYLQGQEPTKKDIDDSKILFAYDANDIEQLFKANNGTFTTKLLTEDDSSAQVPISLHRDSVLLESYARWVMHKQLINNRN